MTDTWEPAQQVIGLLDGRWTLALLHNGGRRYQELDDALGAATATLYGLPILAGPLTHFSTPWASGQLVRVIPRMALVPQVESPP